MGVFLHKHLVFVEILLQVLEKLLLLDAVAVLSRKLGFLSLRGEQFRG